MIDPRLQISQGMKSQKDEDKSWDPRKILTFIIRGRKTKIHW